MISKLLLRESIQMRQQWAVKRVPVRMSSSEHRVSRQIDQDQILPCQVPASPCHNSLRGKMGIIVSFLAGQWSNLHKTVAKLTVTEYWLYQLFPLVISFDQNGSHVRSDL